jgi:hypothetical protein
LHFDVDQIGFHSLRLNVGSFDSVQSVDENPGVRVVLGQSRPVMGKRVQCGCGQDTGLPHRSAPAFSQAAAFLNQRARPAKRAAYGCPQAF